MRKLFGIGRRLPRIDGAVARRAPSPLARRLAFETLEGRQLLAATTIGVLAAGQTGTEQFQLLINGAVVATFGNPVVLDGSRSFQTFTYTHPTDVTINQIRVAFTNDGTTPSGGDRNLYVDGVTINGVKFESEAPDVYSTGTWDQATNGLLPGFRQTEALHYDGYFQYGAAPSTIQILAAGHTGEEQMQLLVAGQVVATYDNIGGNDDTRSFVTYTYQSPGPVSIDQIRIAFTNDSVANGLDRNLRVDAVILDGTRYETEAPNVFSTGTFIPGQGVIPGNWQSEYLHATGYFQYGTTPVGGGGSTIQILAAGHTGQEEMQLLVAGQVVATYDNVSGNDGTRDFQTFTYQSPVPVTIDQIRVAFTNDAFIAGQLDRNLRVDAVVIDGVRYETEAADVYSTGTYVDGLGVVPGLWQSEYLHANGYFQFASGAKPGVLGLSGNQFYVDEFAGTVTIPVLRTGGADGTVGLRYTTINGTALAGSDYTATSGTVVFGPGETTKNIVVPILQDNIVEANETFAVTADLVIGGGTILEPRTATVTIVDDENPPVAGTGAGLLGQYFNHIDLTGPVFSRTDSTVNFDWGTTAPASSLPADNFSVRWTGKIQPLYSQTYTFQIAADDGVRLYVNNQLVIDKWIDQRATVSGTIALQRGRLYDIRLEYYEHTDRAQVILKWQSASQALALIPQTQLYSDPPAPAQNGFFSAQTLVSGLNRSTAMDFDSTGRAFISTQPGIVYVFQGGQLLPTPFLDISSRVNFVQDRGMVGIAVDPQFPAKPYIYVGYTYDPPETASNTGNAGLDGSGNRVARVSRFTADPATGYNTAIPGSELILEGTNSTWANISHPELDSTDDITIPPSGGANGEGKDVLIADSRSHTLGNLAFGPDGMLYIASGDGASFGRTDPRAERAVDIDSLSGKILRVDPATGQGVADNPFFNGDPTANRSKVYDYGLRNPFRFAFQPGTGQLYIGDVGWATWEEINTGRGKNFGWPYYEGMQGQSLPTGGYSDLPEAKAYYATNPAVTPPLWSRSHSNGAVAEVLGDFYTGNIYPTSFKGALFFTDFGDEQIKVLRLNPDGSLNSVVPLSLNAGVLVEMTMGKDGYIYYVDLAGNVGRLTFTATSAAIAPTPAQIGDFNGDNEVNGADFLLWQQGLGAPTVFSTTGDSNDDGTVTADDLQVWKDNFGDGTGASSGAVAPAAAGVNAAPFWLSLDDGDSSTPIAAAALAEPLQGSLVNAGLAPASSGVSAAVAGDIAGNDSSVNVDHKATDEALATLDDDPLTWRSAL